VLILNHESFNESISCGLLLLRNVTVKIHLFLAPQPLSSSEMDHMNRALLEANDNILYFMAHPSYPGAQFETLWKQVLTVKNQPKVVINRLAFSGMLDTYF